MICIYVLVVINKIMTELQDLPFPARAQTRTPTSKTYLLQLTVRKARPHSSLLVDTKDSNASLFE